MTKRWMISTLVVVSGALALGGCYYGSGGLGGEPEADGTTASAPRASGGSTGSNVTVGAADQFAGDLGTVTGFAVPGAELRVTQSPSTASVRIDAENTRARWWAMTVLTIQGGLNHPSLQPGTQLRFQGGRSGSTNGLTISVLGCSGPRRDNFTYDGNATAVEVNVEEGPSPDTRRLVFDADFNTPQGPQRVHGSFVYDPR